jgi:hypothetical protein
MNIEDYMYFKNGVVSTPYIFKIGYYASYGGVEFGDGDGAGQSYYYGEDHGDGYGSECTGGNGYGSGIFFGTSFGGGSGNGDDFSNSITEY